MTLRFAAAPLACLSLAACVPPAPEPTPAPPLARAAPSPVATPTPTPGPVARPTSWIDAPQTPGDWFYTGGAQTSAAAFGPPQSEARFSLRCDRRQRTITLVRPGAASGPVPLRILTETGERGLNAAPLGQELPTLAATLPATDPILDAMAFSKGRFAVETAGMPPLYLPSWPEVTRVIEDCR